MEDELDVNSGLDYALLHFSFGQNSYEALAFSKGRVEKISSGCLDQLLSHLPSLRGLDSDQCDSFKLQPSERWTDTTWFRKSSLKMFLNFVNAPEELSTIEAIKNELGQLEDTRSFHVALYTKDKQSHPGDCSSDNGCLKEVESLQRVKVETVTSDATKNELLRALDLRLMALKEELVNVLERLMGVRCSKGQFSDLVAFVDHFGNNNLRNILLKYLTLKYDDTDTSHAQTELPTDSDKCIKDMAEERNVSRASSLSASRNGISPAKIAQAERESPTESEESSNSSDEERAFAERSRPVIRSASPRRSASPMRRIQIGRSGSRRTTAITIKSLNHFPAREKISCSRETEENDNEESVEQIPKKSENSLTRMSVQDRINLFESKQRDQLLDIQKKNSGTEVQLGNKKSVLRRWSSGIGDLSFQCPQEIFADSKCENSSNNLVLEPKSNSTEEEDDTSNGVCVKSDDNIAAMLPLETKEMLSPLSDSQDLVVHQFEDAPERAAASTEWTRQKEAELDQLMKMMEIKTAKSGGLTSASGGDQELFMDKKVEFYRQKKDKKDEKLRPVNSGKRTEKDAKSKVMQNATDQRNVEVVKKVGASGKLNPSVQQQKIRRNSSPPVLSTKNSSNPVALKKTPPKTSSPAVAKRNSLPLSPAQRPAGVVQPKTSPRTTTCTPNRRKPNSVASPTTIGPQSERPKKPKGTKSIAAETKPVLLKSQEENKLKVMTKEANTPKAKSPVILVDEAGPMPTKPSFYNKVTRKGSVVPLEPKPYLKKGTGGSGVGTAKAKPLQFDDPIKNSDPPQEAETKEPDLGALGIITHPPQLEVAQPANDAEVNREGTPSDTEACPDESENNDMHLQDESIIQLSESPVVDIQQEEDLGISSAAWVEADHHERHDYSQNGHTQSVVPCDVVPATMASPRVRHSLSQMLQADSTESDIIEWGNAENPPALVYQKDAPKGLKRLLKFARKSKGESNATGLSSPSVFSDGEEDTEESKAANKKNRDVFSRRATSKTNISGKSKNLLSESFDGGNSSKRLNEHLTTHDMLSASMNLPAGLHKIREGSGSSATGSSKGSRSFFSLSTFRSSKSGDAKLR